MLQTQQELAESERVSQFDGESYGKSCSNLIREKTLDPGLRRDDGENEYSRLNNCGHPGAGRDPAASSLYLKISAPTPPDKA